MQQKMTSQRIDKDDRSAFGQRAASVLINESFGTRGEKRVARSSPVDLKAADAVRLKSQKAAAARRSAARRWATTVSGRQSVRMSGWKVGLKSRQMKAGRSRGGAVKTDAGVARSGRMSAAAKSASSRGCVTAG